MRAMRAFVLIALVLSACGDDDTPTPTPDASPDARPDARPDAMPVNECVDAIDCAACAATGGCGWCGTGRCVSGDADGPHDGTCGGENAPNIFEAHFDFNVDTNPSSDGVWAYGASDTADGAITLLDRFDEPSGEQRWSRDDNATPAVSRDPDTSSHPDGDFFMGSVFRVSTDPNDFAVVEWTAPGAGAYRVYAAVIDLASSGAPVMAQLFVKGAMRTLPAGSPPGPDVLDGSSSGPIAGGELFMPGDKLRIAIPPASEREIGVALAIWHGGIESSWQFGDAPACE